VSNKNYAFYRLQNYLKKASDRTMMETSVRSLADKEEYTSEEMIVIE